MSIIFNPEEQHVTIRCANKKCRASNKLYNWSIPQRFEIYTAPARSTKYRIIEITCRTCGKIQLFAITPATSAHTKTPLQLISGLSTTKPGPSTTNANMQFIQDYVAYTEVKKADMEKVLKFIHKEDPHCTFEIRVDITREELEELINGTPASRQSTTQHTEEEDLTPHNPAAEKIHNETRAALFSALGREPEEY